jgi:hypothetical protein
MIWVTAVVYELQADCCEQAYGLEQFTCCRSLLYEVHLHADVRINARKQLYQGSAKAPSLWCCELVYSAIPTFCTIFIMLLKNSSSDRGFRLHQDSR